MGDIVIDGSKIEIETQVEVEVEIEIEVEFEVEIEVEVDGHSMKQDLREQECGQVETNFWFLRKYFFVLFEQKDDGGGRQFLFVYRYIVNNVKNELPNKFQSDKRPFEPN